MATHSSILAWKIPWTEKPGATSFVAQMVKNLPAMWETHVQSLGGEDPLEKEMASHSSILAWRILWAEKPGGLHSKGCKESDMTESLTLSLFTAQNELRTTFYHFYR